MWQQIPIKAGNMQTGQKSSSRSNLNLSPTGTYKVNKKQVSACHKAPESLKIWRYRILWRMEYEGKVKENWLKSFRNSLTWYILLFDSVENATSRPSPHYRRKPNIHFTERKWWLWKLAHGTGGHCTGKRRVKGGPTLFRTGTLLAAMSYSPADEKILENSQAQKGKI